MSRRDPPGVADSVEHLDKTATLEIARSIDLDALIEDFQRKVPFPEEQVERAKKRSWLAARLPKHGIGAEIGVFRGHFAEVLSEITIPKRLYLVDPWTLTGETFDRDTSYTSGGGLKTSEAYEEAKARAIRGGTSDVFMVQGFFPHCKGRILDRLDWAYLDASHSYEATIAELDALDTLMSPSGVIAGDDWRPRPSDRHHGVFKAVQEFTQKSPWKIVMCGYLGQWMLKRF